MITVKHKGNFNNFESFCNRMFKRDYLDVISAYADLGVEALKAATPVKSGQTASSWDYEIESKKGITTLWFTNSHEENGANVAVLLIYGHGKKDGGYVEGIDFVSPALRPIFQDLADAMWKEVKK